MEITIIIVIMNAAVDIYKANVLPSCRRCSSGHLYPKYKQRFPTPIVILGYLFMAGGLLGTLVVIVTLAGAGTFAAKISAESISQPTFALEAASPQIIAAKREAKKITESAATITAGAFSLVSMTGFFTSCLPAILIGWFLASRKEVLKCTCCGIVERTE